MYVIKAIVNIDLFVGDVIATDVVIGIVFLFSHHELVNDDVGHQLVESPSFLTALNDLVFKVIRMLK
jgi:hypothetical protein